MNLVMKTAPISDMKRDQAQVMNLLPDGPVVLMQRSQPAAVMVKPEQWNAIAEEIEDLRDVIASLEAELAIATGEETPKTVSPDELRQGAVGNAVPA